MLGTFRVVLLGWLVVVVSKPQGGRIVFPWGIVVNIPLGSMRVENKTQKGEEDARLLLTEVEFCERNAQNGDGPNFHIRLFGSLLEGGPKDQSDFQCSITKEIVEEVHLLDIFRRIYTPVFDQLDATEPQPSLPTFPPSIDKNDLELKLGEYLIEDQPKIPHVRNIYLGTSIYPLLFQESRIVRGSRMSSNPTEHPLETSQQEKIYWLQPGSLSRNRQTNPT